MNIIKRLFAVLSFTALFIGLMGFSPVHAEEGDFHYTVVSKDFSYDEAEFSINQRERLLIDGATQLTWWAPDHNVTLTKKSIRKAPRLKVRYTKCATQSKSIAKQAKGSAIVIALPGSVICNTGMNGNIVGGFKWHVTKGPAVLKWNKKLKLYEHVFNLIRPGNVQADDEVVGYIRVGGIKYAIVKTCKNRMGGHVDVMYDKVTQVRYLEDVMESGIAEANAEVNGSATFEITCPNGATFRTTVSTKASAHSEAEITFSERTRVSVLAAKKFELEQKLKVDGDAKAMATAESKIEVWGNCGSNPEPEFTAPTASGNAKACVKPGEANGVITAVGTNPNDVAAPGTLTVGGQTKQFASVGAGQSVTWDFSGFAPGTYSGSFTLGSPVSKSATFSVTVQQCASTPRPSLVEISTINDVLVNNSRTNTVSGSVAPGHTGQLFCTARNGGTITAGKQQTVNGNFSVQHTYRAPSEVPGANSQYGIAAGRDRVDCTLTQDDGQTATISSNQFEIRPAPVDPM